MSAFDPLAEVEQPILLCRTMEASCDSLIADGVGTGLTMRRREFIALLATVAAAWPRIARAQQAERVRLVCILRPIPEDMPGAKAQETAFLEGLRQLGWTSGRNVRIEGRWGSGDEATTRKYAAELIALAPDVIVTSGSLGAEVMLKATHTIPIVFVIVPDPVGSGYVESLSRPGGNATGFMMFEYNLCGKWLELLKEIAPSVTHAAVLRDPNTPAGIGQFAVIQSVAPSVGIEVSPIELREPDQIEPAIARFAQRSNGGIILAASGIGAANVNTIIAAAARYKLPAVYIQRPYVTAGGLISYGPNFADQSRRAADYVDRILRGEKPADLPVQAPNKYELAINLKTAKALGLSVPQSLLARADEVIE
jgi:putative ABC transport system substrate-binding protein